MGEHFDKLPQRVREHLRSLVGPAGLKDVEGGEELLAEGWLEKQRAFEHHTAGRGMVGVEAYSKDEAAGALMMTYSGSLVSIGPMTDGARDVAYASIGIRRDVPQLLVTQDCRLAGDVAVGEVVQFEEGPVQKTSPVYAIMVFDASLPPAKENAALAELTEALAQHFVDINNETLAG